MIHEDKTLKLVALGLGTVSLVALLRGLHRREMQLAARRQGAKDGSLNGTPQTAPDKGLGEIGYGHEIVGDLPTGFRLKSSEFAPGKIVFGDEEKLLKHMEKHSYEISRLGLTLKQFIVYVAQNYDTIRLRTKEQVHHADGTVTERATYSLLFSATWKNQQLTICTKANQAIDDRGKNCWLVHSAEPRRSNSTENTPMVWSGDASAHPCPIRLKVVAPTSQPSRRGASLKAAQDRKKAIQDAENRHRSTAFTDNGKHRRR